MSETAIFVLVDAAPRTGLPELLVELAVELDTFAGFGVEVPVVEVLKPLASSAKPTAAGLARKTEYTFLRNVSPMIQVGTPEPLPTLVPISKIPPAHSPLEVPEMELGTEPMFMSAGLIVQAEPPNDMVTVTSVLQGNANRPSYSPVSATEPGTWAQIFAATVLGAAMRVVPVSMAARVLDPTLTVLPCTESELTLSNQYDGALARLKYSIEPWYKLEFVPPRVRVPPGAESVTDWSI